MDDFFINENSIVDPDANISKKKRAMMVKAAKEFISARRKRSDSSSEEIEDVASDASDAESSESDTETPAQKRLRLAKRYLAELEEEVGENDEVDAADLDKDLIASRLRNDALESVGKLFNRIAEKFAHIDPNALEIKTLKGHDLSVTGVSLASIEGETPSMSSKQIIYSVSKDASIIKWDFFTGKKLFVHPGGLKPTKKLLKRKSEKKLKEHKGHSDHILAVCASYDGKYLVTGGRDKLVYIWSVESNELLGTFKHHRDAVSGLAFRKGKNHLYSVSLDRTVKVWDVDEMAYIETLFGHQDHIPCIATLSKERCVTCGSRDRTVRLWKIPEESQLVFRGAGVLNATEDLVVMDGLAKKKTDKNHAESGGSIDTVCMIEEDLFISGSDAGAISLWSVTKKKPIFTKFKAHSSENSTWICSLAAIPHSDLFASGSNDGFIRLWKLSPTKKSFSPLISIPMTGFINALQFAEVADTSIGKKKILYLIAGIGQEHRLGRWERIKEAKNCVKIIKIE